jgi:hypothetical protein
MEQHAQSIGDAIWYVLTASENTTESVRGFLGFTIQGNQIRGRNKAPAVMIDTGKLTQTQIQLMCYTLHEHEILFRVINEGFRDSSSMQRHIRWFMQQTDRAKPLLDTYLPDRTLNFEDWREWYMETVEFILQSSRSFQTYMCIPAAALEIPQLHFLHEYTLTKTELTDYFMRLWTGVGDSPATDQVVLWDPLRSQDKSYTDLIVPGKIEISKDRVMAQSTLDGTTTQFSSITVGSIPLEEENWGRIVSTLRELCLPLISEGNTVYLTLDVFPVSERRKRQLTGIIKSRVRGEKKSRKSKRVVTRADEHHWDALEGVAHDIESRDRMAFGYYLTITLRSEHTDPLRDVSTLRKALIEQFRDHEIRYDAPRGVLDHGELFRSCLPVVDHVLDMDRVMPQADAFVRDSLVSHKMPVPINGMLAGEYVSGDPLILGGLLKTYLVTGGLGSGKSSVIKAAAINFLYLQPQGKVIVVDNAGYTPGVNSDKRTREEGLKGWIDICRAFGGIAVFSEDYQTSEELYTALSKLSNKRFILYYPDQRKPDNDVVFLTWQVEEFKRVADPRTYGERDVQQMACYDDVLSWFARMEDPRGRYFTHHTLNAVKANGVLTLVAVQTPESIAQADRAAHAQLVQDMEVSINFKGGGYAQMARALGVEGTSLEATSLSRQITEALADLTRQSLREPEGPRPCTVVIGNVMTENAFIVIHPRLRAIIDRMAG